MRTHLMNHPLPDLRHALAAALLAGAALPAAAADFLFSGSTDSGSLNPATFSGTFSYADPLAGFDGSVTLSAFSLSFAGQAYTLAGADAGTQPVAGFVAGSFVGIDYQDTRATLPGPRPQVLLTAGFTALDQAFFSYDASGAGVEGFGSYTVSAVPEPAAAALWLAGLALLGSARRRLNATDAGHAAGGF